MSAGAKAADLSLEELALLGALDAREMKFLLGGEEAIAKRLAARQLVALAHGWPGARRTALGTQALVARGIALAPKGTAA